MITPTLVLLEKGYSNKLIQALSVKKVQCRKNLSVIAKKCHKKAINYDLYNIWILY